MSLQLLVLSQSFLLSCHATSFFFTFSVKHFVKVIQIKVMAIIINSSITDIACVYGNIRGFLSHLKVTSGFLRVHESSVLKSLKCEWGKRLVLTHTAKDFVTALQRHRLLSLTTCRQHMDLTNSSSPLSFEALLNYESATGQVLCFMCFVFLFSRNETNLAWESLLVSCDGKLK